MDNSKFFTFDYRGTYWAIRTPVDNNKNVYYCVQGYVLGNTYPCRGFLASPKGYVLPTHIAHLGRLDGFNLPSNNVNTMSLARTYPGIPSSSYEMGGAIPPSRVGPEMSQYEPPAFGRRFVLPFQGLRVSGGIAPPISRTVFLDTSSPDSWYSIISVPKKCFLSE